MIVDMDEYEKWLEEQVCLDCGRSYKDRPQDEKGRKLDMWVTGVQCFECWEKHGALENRGFPSAGEMFARRNDDKF